MTDSVHIFVRFLLRLLLAVPLIVGGVFLIRQASGGFAAIGILLIAMSCMLMGAVILSRPLTELFAQPIENLFFPGERFNEAPPNYSIPTAIAKKGDLEEAMKHYQEIAENYPKEVKPWLEMLHLAVFEMKDADRAKSVYRDGLVKLKTEKSKETLIRLYKSIAVPDEAKKEDWYGSRKIPLRDEADAKE